MLEVGVKVDLSEMETLARKYPDVSKEVRKEKILEALLVAEGEVKNRTPFGAGPIHLRDSIHPSGPHIRGEQVYGTLGTPLEYGEPVELGTKPHWAPLEPLIWWVEKVIGESGVEAKRIAKAIQFKIAKKGTQGSKMFGDGFEASRPTIEGILETITAEIVNRIGGK